jgi:hypothetical protein
MKKLFLETDKLKMYLYNISTYFDKLTFQLSLYKCNCNVTKPPYLHKIKTKISFQWGAFVCLPKGFDHVAFFSIGPFGHKLVSYTSIIVVRAEVRRPLWNEIWFCERVTATSLAFSLVIIADHSDWYEGIWLSKMKCPQQWIANWRISQCKHIQMKLSYPSINRTLRFFFY